MKEFSAKNPELDDFEEKLKVFSQVEDEIENIVTTFQVGAMALMTEKLKDRLKEYSKMWKMAFTKDLHKRAKHRLESLFDYIKTTTNKLAKDVTTIDSLRFVMSTLKQIREKESEIELEIRPIEAMYALLDKYYSHGMDRDEIDARGSLKRK